MSESLTERERRVLEAIVQSYVETAEPVGSRTIARRFGLGVSPATVRNAMSDLEEKGYLFHPHTSAGRVPTDRAYRMYVDSLMRFPALSAAQEERLREDLIADGSAISAIIHRAAQVLSVLTQELGVAVAPSLDSVVLERLELLTVGGERLLLVLTLRSGVARSVFVEVPGTLHPEAVVSISLVLNDRLAGLTLREIRQTLPERVRDTAKTSAESELLDIFVSTGDQIFDLANPAPDEVVIGRTSVLAEQPEFATGPKMRELIAADRAARGAAQGPRVARQLGGPHRHHRRREREREPVAAHPHHRTVPVRPAVGRDRGPGADPDALREGRDAGRAHVQAGRGSVAVTARRWSGIVRAAR